MFSLSYILTHKLFKHSIIYTVSGVIGRSIPFLLLPVLTRYLNPSEYGIVSMFEILLAILVVLVGLNMPSAVGITYFKLDREEFREYIGNAALLILISFAFFLGLAFFLGKPIGTLINTPAILVVAAVAAAGCKTVFLGMSSIWRVEQQPLKFGVFQISWLAADIGLSLLLIVLLGLRWEGRILGIVISLAVFALISAVILKRNNYVLFRFRREYIRDALFFGFPLIPHMLGGILMTGIDRFFINSMVNVAATGIYTVGYQVGMIINVLTTSFNLAWAPFLLNKLNQNNPGAKITIVRFTYLYFISVLLLALALTFAAPYLLKIFVGEEFQSASRYVGWVAFGYAAYGMYFMVVNYIFYVKKTYLLAAVTFGSALINMILNYILIKAHGPIGAAQATTITFVLVFIAVWWLSARVYSMPWSLKYVLKR